MSQLALFLEEHAPPADEVPTAIDPAPEAIPLEAVLGDDASPIRWTFDCMELAEEAMSAARAEHRNDPRTRHLLGRAFAVLCPRWDVFGGLNPAVIRAHMNELLRRIAAEGKDADLVPGTAAEVCCAMEHLSLAAPLKHDHHVVYELAFIDALGEAQAVEILGEEAVRRAQMDREHHLKAEIYNEVRHQIRDEDRKDAWKESLERTPTPDPGS